jgi:hypothetical protein
MEEPPRTLLPVRGASLALRLGIAVQCATLAWIALEHYTTINSVLFMNLGTAEETAHLVDRWLAVGALVVAVGMLVRPVAVLALVASVLFLLVAIATSVDGGHRFAHLAPLSGAVRWLGPLALAVLWFGRRVDEPTSTARVDGASWVLRVAVAATFLGHGWEALQHHPAFVDLVLGSLRRMFGEAPSEAAVRSILTGIGVLDLALAALVLVRRWSWVVAWMALWGFATAASRTLALGTGFAHETALRTLNGAAPLALLLLWRSRGARSAPEAG